MAVSHGMTTYFAVEDAAGSTLRNLTPYITDVTLSAEQDEAQTTTKGQSWETYIQGHSRATIEITGRWDDTVTSGPHVVLAGLFALATTVGFEVGWEGNSTGDVKESGECICTGYERQSPLAGVVGFTASFRVTGAITQGTFA